MMNSILQPILNKTSELVCQLSDFNLKADIELGTELKKGLYKLTCKNIRENW